MEPEVLECQNCGEVLQELSPAQAQQVAADSYRFVVFCRRCVRLAGLDPVES